MYDELLNRYNKLGLKISLSSVQKADRTVLSEILYFFQELESEIKKIMLSGQSHFSRIPISPTKTIICYIEDNHTYLFVKDRDTIRQEVSVSEMLEFMKLEHRFLSRLKTWSTYDLSVKDAVTETKDIIEIANNPDDIRGSPYNITNEIEDYVLE